MVIPEPHPDEISLYIHVPFCRKKCGYCHFFVLPNKPEYHRLLLKGIHLEWQKQRELLKGKTLTSIYFGGGTPYLFGAENTRIFLETIFSVLSFDKNIEITLEANPYEMEKKSLKDFRDAGINRLSLGVQSLEDSLLKILTREHTREEAINSINEAKEVGFDDISIDLMYEIPGQTLKLWENTLNSAISLPITHLSLYNLTFEPHTSFYKRKDQLIKLLPAENESLAMIQSAVDHFNNASLKRYEISAFAREGKYSRHNTGYWLGRSFLGFGPSAYSYYRGKRYRNVANLNQYMDKLEAGLSPVDFEEELPQEQKLREHLAIRLRLIQGVHLPTFERLFTFLPTELKLTLHRLEEQGFLKQEEERIFLSTQGILLYDSIAVELI
jgi:oxygen-independent coproporphyrinogen-3 oxidase